MSRHEPQLAGSQIPEDFRREFHIGEETGIGHSYFNDLLSLMLGDIAVIENPDDYFFGGEKEMREKLQEALRKFPSYSEDIKELVKNYNHDQERSGGSKRITVNDFKNPQNEGVVRKLDEMALTIKAMKDLSPEQIDIPKLKQIIYEMSLLVYGESSRETLKQLFKIT